MDITCIPAPSIHPSMQVCLSVLASESACEGVRPWLQLGSPPTPGLEGGAHSWGRGHSSPGSSPHSTRCGSLPGASVHLSSTAQWECEVLGLTQPLGTEWAGGRGAKLSPCRKLPGPMYSSCVTLWGCGVACTRHRVATSGNRGTCWKHVRSSQNCWG